MTISLKTTVFASSAVAVLLNVGQFVVTYNQQARAAYAPSWAADAASARPAPTPLATKAHAQILPTPVSAAAPAATQSVAAASTPPPVDNETISVAARLSNAGLKPVFAASYLSVAARTGTPWQLLAAVHETETGQSGDTARRSYAGATGPMQFMPATFARYALDGDGNGTKDITNFQDSLLTAGRYLAAGGAARGNYQTALYNYNHSNAYVSHVLAIAHRLGL